MDKTKSEKLKNDALLHLECLISDYILHDDSRADKLSYWLKDYSNYLSFEKNFNPRKNKRYKRGEILKVNLGYNIGSEEGGVHYCAVLDKNNALSSPVITVIPLTSIKGPLPQILPTGNLHIGSQIYYKLQNKIKEKSVAYLEKLNSITPDDDTDAFNQQLQAVASDVAVVQKMKAEISRMKMGSIALVNQITTISKMRIIDPKNTAGVLSGIRLDNDILNKIDAKITELYLK